MTTGDSDDREVAAEYLVAELEPLRLGVVKAVLAVVAGLFTGPGMYEPATSALVVRRIDNGAEVLRTPADLGEPELLLEQVRLDLETKTVEEFVAEWREVDSDQA